MEDQCPVRTQLIEGLKRNLQRPSICGLFPELQKLCYNVGASVAQTYGEFPAWRAALPHTEVRDGAGLCYHDHDRAACRQATGADIPAEIGGKWGGIGVTSPHLTIGSESAIALSASFAISPLPFIRRSNRNTPIPAVASSIPPANSASSRNFIPHSFRPRYSTASRPQSP